jgi:hypothetical protein
MEDVMADYHVVFEDSLGNRTWGSYNDREHFKTSYQGKDQIVAEGISHDEATHLVRENDRAVEGWVKYLIQFAEEHADSPELIVMEVNNIADAAREVGKLELLAFGLQLATLRADIKLLSNLIV